MSCIYGLLSGFHDDEGRKYPYRADEIEVTGPTALGTAMEAQNGPCATTGDDSKGTYTFADGSYVDYVLLDIRADPMTA